MDSFSYLSNADTVAIDDLHQQFQNDRESVEPGWRRFFEGFEFAGTSFGKVQGEAPEQFQKEVNVINLIGAYRQRGHLFAKTNPVRARRVHEGPLELSKFNLSEADLNSKFQAGQRVGLGDAKLSDIIKLLEETYCGSIGVEYRHARDPQIGGWLEHKMESCRNRKDWSLDDKKYMLHKLNQAVGFEGFLHTKFVGQKRFSLEGCESIIPALDQVVEAGAELGLRELVIGMAHRGRLNVLANVMMKEYEKIFYEFTTTGFKDGLFSGDVKYHMGYSQDRSTRSGKKVHLSLTPNPSHLETVNPVVQGIVHSKIDFRYDGDLNKCAPLLIHGDAAIAGQGINYELLQLAELDGYRAGGSIHVVLNNQIGFTTNYLDARSSTYCTDLAKVTLSPVFHVNGDDVEAVVYATTLAMEYRQKFHKDVFIDIVGYRKYGHNEGDEPRFTQPVLYKTIEKHRNPREIYNQKLIDGGDVPSSLLKEMDKEFKDILNKDLENSKSKRDDPATSYLEGDWQGVRMGQDKDFVDSPPTGVSLTTLEDIGIKLSQLPKGPKFFSKVVKLFEQRKKMITDTKSLDWAMGELLAYGTLLNEGSSVRISGQDVERGTFSHRHAVVKIEDSEVEFIALRNIDSKQGRFTVFNSILSEYAVLGFETGYSMATPNTLTIWEAQFGDFANGAQIVIDNFIACSETKWQRMNGITILLPHGYEGQGPEHSSARMERFLTLSAENNWTVADCTTPANYFHLLRRQLHRPFRKPLVVFTPKSLLRHPKCVSPLKDFGPKTRFQETLDDIAAKPDKVSRVLLCTGKIYYDLLARQEEDKRTDVAIVRVEQLYPFPKEQLAAIIKRYKKAKQLYWVQEEPENMGAWSFILRKFQLAKIEGIYRRESATTATGFNKKHQQEQKELVDKAFAKN